MRKKNYLLSRINYRRLWNNYYMNLLSYLSSEITDFSFLFSVTSIILIAFITIFSEWSKFLTVAGIVFGFLGLLPGKFYSIEKLRKMQSIRLELAHKYESLNIAYKMKMKSDEEALFEYNALNDLERKLWETLKESKTGKFVPRGK